MGASAAEWVEIEDDDYGSRDQWESPATWNDAADDAADWDSPWLEAGDWGDGPWLEDDGWAGDDGAVQECAGPALSAAALVVVAAVVLVALAAAVLWRSRRGRRPQVVVVTQLEFPLGLGLAGGDGVVPPAERKGSAA